MVVCSLESNREEGSYVCTYVVWRTDETSFLYDLVTALSVPLDVGLKLTRQDYLLDWGFLGDIERVKLYSAEGLTRLHSRIGMYGGVEMG